MNDGEDLGAESRGPNETDEKFEVITRKTLNQSPPCKRGFDFIFECLNDGVCNVHFGTCDDVNVSNYKNNHMYINL